MNLAFRSWWNVRSLKTSLGVHSGLEFGFIKNFLYNIRDHYPAKIILAWDGKPKKGLDLSQDYKANRDKSVLLEEPPWGPRLKKIKDLLSELVLTLYHPETEADEQIARWVFQEESKGNKTLIISNDRDLYQLVTNNTHIKTKGKQEDRIITVQEVKDEWGVDPRRLPLLRSISGDSSDNIKGVPRISTSTKQGLVNRLSSNSIDELINLIDSSPLPTLKEREKLIAGKELINRNFKMMDLFSQVEEPTIYGVLKGDLDQIKLFCQELELKSLVDRGEWELIKSKD